MNKKVEKLIINKLNIDKAKEIKISEKVKTFDGGKIHQEYEILIQIKFKKEGRSETIKIELQFNTINDLIDWILEDS